MTDFIVSKMSRRNTPSNVPPSGDIPSQNHQPSFRQRISERVLTAYLRPATRHYLTLKSANITSLPAPRDGHQYVLYVHVPFCESLCPYCSFNRFLLEENKARVYFRALREEMRQVANLGYHFTSMYIGGGTPTILIDELAQTIDLARELFGEMEVSCETNPNHLTPEIIEVLDGRVQRLSVGVQSFNDSLLKQMNRFEKFGSGVEIQQKIRYAAPHFLSLNVDMIFNFPSQTPEILREDLRMVIESGAQQTTFYPLMSSPSVEKSIERSVGKLDTSREGEYYQIINDTLSAYFTPMSAWTFLRQGGGMIDEYIVDSEEYVGIGSGAFSYMDGTLYVNTFSLNQYQKAIASKRMSVNAVQRYGKHEQMRYRMMMDLFGLNFDRNVFKRRFGVSPAIGLWLEMLFLHLAGAFGGKKRQKITPTGRYLSVVMMREFFTGVNNIRDIARQSLTPEERVCAMPVQKPSFNPQGNKTTLR